MKIQFPLIAAAMSARTNRRAKKERRKSIPTRIRTKRERLLFHRKSSGSGTGCANDETPGEKVWTIKSKRLVKMMMARGEKRKEPRIAQPARPPTIACFMLFMTLKLRLIRSAGRELSEAPPRACATIRKKELAQHTRRKSGKSFSVSSATPQRYAIKVEIKSM